MNPSSLALLSLLMFTAATPADGQEKRAPGVFKTGEELFRACTSTRPADVKACDWYLMGAHDMAAMARDIGLMEADSFCVPARIDAPALREIAIARWRDQPDSRNYSAVSATLNAMTAAFPGACKVDQ